MVVMLDADGKDDPSSESSAPATASANKEDDTPEQPGLSSQPR